MDEAAFLGVRRSFGGRRWVTPPADSRLAMAMAQQLGLPELVARLLVARGVGLDEAEGFLNPTLRRDLPDPSHLLDMDLAVDRLADALARSERIAIFGDYDVDGATSAALLSRYLTACGGEVEVYVPDRVAEGYGPNAPALLALAGRGAKVVITVDCGATAHGPLAVAKEAGLDVIVCDHHVGEPVLPPAWAVVNPNRFDETSPHRQMAAVGVAFLMAVALNRRLRQRGWFNAKRPEPDLLRALDLVALGTVCDVVPLTGVNRALVAQGLKIIRTRENLGMAALADVAGLKETPDAWHLGFLLGPRVNAGGRVGKADQGVRLLTCEDSAQAARLAVELDGWNGNRKEIEALVLEQAIQVVEGGNAGLTHIAFAAGDGWHPGVIGIVAARLKERFNRPAVVVAIDGGIAKASARSVTGVSIGDCVIAARQAGLMMNGGGHAMAAGFTAEAGRLAEIAQFLEDRVAASVAGSDLAPELAIDGLLDPAGADGALLELLSRVGPYGSGNPEPRFALAGMRIVRAEPLGLDHVRCVLAGSNGAKLSAVAWRSLDQPIGQALMRAAGGVLHVAGTLRADTYRGRDAARLTIDDVAHPV
jgi:single-stranded-DNA-specific exonuclease